MALSGTLALFGGGNMGGALLAGLIERGGFDPGAVLVVEPVAARRDELNDRHPGVRVVSAPDGDPVDAAVVAVKPQDVPAAAAMAAAAGARRLLSVAAGVPTARIEEVAGPGVAVVRAMPNTPALVGRGATAIAAGSSAGPDDVAWARSILELVGVVVEVKESDLDAVTGLSGSGPAYVFLVAEALVDAGVLAGLSRAVSVALVQQLLAGSVELWTSAGRSPADLRAEVTSPGGTTAAGLLALERAGVRAAFLEAVAAATERSRELGRASS
jgi:pyrroline-5-carboxylate reductase